VLDVGQPGSTSFLVGERDIVTVLYFFALEETGLRTFEGL
jgi:hypothetical protein